MLDDDSFYIRFNGNCHRLSHCDFEDGPIPILAHLLVSIFSLPDAIVGLT